MRWLLRAGASACIPGAWIAGIGAFEALLMVMLVVLLYCLVLIIGWSDGLRYVAAGRRALRWCCDLLDTIYFTCIAIATFTVAVTA